MTAKTELLKPSAPPTLPQLPNGWVWTRLGNVLGFVKGKRPENLGPQNKILTIPYINIKAFEKRVFNEYTDSENCPLCAKDDILIVWDGARCGLVGKGVSGVIGSTLAKLVCDSIDKIFLFYFLQTQYEYINKRPRGVGIPHVEPNVFWNIHIPLPPLPEQGRIVAKIEELFTRLDAGVSALKKVRDELKRYRQAVLKSAFEGKLTQKWREENKDAKEWKQIKLEECVTILDSKRMPVNVEEREKRILGKPKSDIYPYYGATGQVGWIDGYIFDEELVLLGEDGVPFFDSFKSKAYVIRGKTWVNNHAHVLKAIDGITFNAYLCYYLNGFDYHEYVTGTTRAKLNQSSMRKISVLLPSLPEQHQIVSEIEERFSVADEVEKVVEQGLKQAARLRQSILKKAFEGKLVPQDPQDEPAEKLLERIKKERLTAETFTPHQKRCGARRSPRKPFHKETMKPRNYS